MSSSVSSSADSSTRSSVSFSLSWVTDDLSHSHRLKKVFLRCAVVALICEGLVLTGIAWREHWLAHPQKTTGLDESQFIEANVFEVPRTEHLVEEKKVKVPAPPPHAETTLSKAAGKGREAKPEEKTIEEENQTQEGPKMAPTHGPVAVYAPRPVIPPYLMTREFKASVVIYFLVNSRGEATPQLVSSSGNEELDAIAIATVKRWQFRPAEKDHHPVDSKVKLRIQFEVQ